MTVHHHQSDSTLSKEQYEHGLGSIPDILNGLISRRLTSTGITRHLLQRLDKLNPALNMTLIRRHEAVLAEAAASDARLNSGRARGILEGLPVTIKDAFDTEGIETTSGTLHRRGRIPEQDSTCVHHWRERGALVLAKSNTPEFAHALETTNLVVGRTQNPWSPAHTIGGSSGGEAALLASGCSILGMGSDMCGSVRIPAHFAGVCALKLSNETVVRDGHPPFLPQHIFQLAGVGPMARTILDLKAGFFAMAGLDEKLSALVSNPSTETDMESMPRIMVAFEHDTALSAPAKDVLARASALLRTLGCRIESETHTALNQAVPLWDDITRADGRKAMRAAISDHQPLIPWWEMLRNVVGLGRRHWLSFVWIYLDYFKESPPLNEVLAQRESHRTQLLKDLGEERIVLMPVTPRPAQQIRDFSAMTTMTRYVRAANVYGLPALSLPILLPDIGRLPMGVQLMGPPGSELRLLQLGQMLERAVHSDGKK